MLCSLYFIISPPLFTDKIIAYYPVNIILIYFSYIFAKIKITIMKKILTLLLIIPLFIACSKDDDKEDVVKTSFSIRTEGELYVGGIAAILSKDNKYIRVASIFSLSGSTSKIYELPSDTITRLYIFSDGEIPIEPSTMRPLRNKFDTIYIIEKGKVNNLVLSNNTKYKLVYGDDETKSPK